MIKVKKKTRKFKISFIIFTKLVNNDVIFMYKLLNNLIDCADLLNRIRFQALRSSGGP